MSNFANNFDMGYLMDDENTAEAFFAYIIKNGRGIIGYSGIAYINLTMNALDNWITAEINEKEKAREMVAYSTHCTGHNIWELESTGIDLTVKGEPKESVIIFTLITNNDEGGGIIPIEIINPDVLPDLTKGAKVKLKVVGFPSDIKYYKDDKEYEEDRLLEDGKEKMLLGDNVLFPSGFLHNHAVNPQDINQSEPVVNKDTDSLIVLKCRVEGFLTNAIKFGTEKIGYCIECVVNTKYGKLNLIHTLEQVPEKYRDNMKTGAIVEAVCVISADSAIYEYEKGCVYDKLNDLKLLRGVMMGGTSRKLEGALSESVRYKNAAGDEFVGKQAVLTQLNSVAENYNRGEDRVFIDFGTVIYSDASQRATQNNEESVGDNKVLLIYYGNQKTAEAVVSINEDKEGKIILIETKQFTDDIRLV